MTGKRISAAINFKKNTIIMKYIFLVFIIFTIAFLLLCFPKQAGEGVSNGINICLKSVVPSLFPFMVLSSTFSKSGICERLGKPFEKLTYFLFRQPAVCVCVILMSNIGGFPIGAGMIKSLFENSKITENEGKRLLMFCINPGPAFVINYVGAYLLSSVKAGVIIYVSVVISSLIIGILTRFIADESKSTSVIITPKIEYKNENESIILSFVEAVKESTASIISVCSWIIVFSSVSSIIDLLNLNSNTKLFLSAILEVTNACDICVKILPIAIIAGIIGWSGICVHFQIMHAIIKLRLSLKVFLTSRIINAAIAVMICKSLLDFFPVDISVFKSQTESFALSSAGSPVSLGLFLMCLMLLVGDNLIVVKRKRLRK